MSKNNFSWREMWVCNEDHYKDRNGEFKTHVDVVPFKMIRDKVNLPETMALRVGTVVMVDFYLGGHDYNNNAFASLEITKVSISGFDPQATELGIIETTQSPVPVMSKPTNVYPPEKPASQFIPEEYKPLPENDDLPF